MVAHVLFVAPFGARRRVVQILHPDRAAIEDVLRSTPAWQRADRREWYNRVWRFAVLARPDVDRAISEALGPKRWRPGDEAGFEVVHRADCAADGRQAG